MRKIIYVSAIFFLCAFGSVLVFGAAGHKSKDVHVKASKEMEINRPIQSSGLLTEDDSAWERNQQNLIWNFYHMYQPCVLEFPGEEYPYKMWFFGWSCGFCNPLYPGCDAIFLARSKDLKNWQIYSGENGWDDKMDYSLWIAVIVPSDKFYDCWHNADPSVVYKDGLYYMAYSATSKPNTVADQPFTWLSCIMGATSRDGIHWKKTDQPLLVEPSENSMIDKDWFGAFHRPSLMWDQEKDKWRLWFDYLYAPIKERHSFTIGYAFAMGYAENTGEFGAKDSFKFINPLEKPLIKNWPNPEVIRVNGTYYSFSDPVGYLDGEGWAGRQLCEAVSDDGLNWKIVGYIPPDTDAVACQVPQTLVTTIDGKKWLYLFYATQRGGLLHGMYDYRCNRIRAMRREIKTLKK